MQNQIEKQTIPTAKVIFAPGQGGRSPEVKRCGYCDRLVRWTIVEERNVAFNCDGSRHQCLKDGTAKRKEPVRHARPSQAEMADFLTRPSERGHQQEEQAACKERTRDSEIRAMHDANVAAWKAQTEGISRLADAMLNVAKSNNALAESNRRLAMTYGRLAHAMERVKRPHR